MSVMTAGEQRRRAAATRKRAMADAAPGQRAVTAEGQPSGAAPAPRRHRAVGPGTRHLTVVAPPRTSRPEAAGTARRDAAPPKPARAQTAPPPAMGPQTVRHQMARSAGAQPGVARPRTARQTQPRARPDMARPETARTAVAHPETAPARPVRTRTRLTRRGRIVVAALITAGVVLVAALAWLAGTTRAQAAGSGPPASAVYHSLRSVVVQPGESLWAIAEQADPAGDPRSVMQEIIDLNALHGTSVQPGQRLWLPRG